MKYVELPQEYDDFIRQFVPGVKFRIISPFPVGPKKRKVLYHVLGVFDDIAIVVKYFRNDKKWWHYEVKDGYSLWLSHQDYKNIRFVK